jgi:hypothetical protein
MVSKNFILLTGAGFSRNWGGWLASEAFEYLLGCPEVDAGLRDLLWRQKRVGGFEGALAKLQQEHHSGSTSLDPQLANLQKALLRMFADMDAAFGRVQFEFQNSREYLIALFLTRFHAIFTLNQDLLLERHYLNDNVSLLSAQRWDGAHIPGMRRIAAPASAHGNPNLGRWEPVGNFSLEPRLQPFFKLHGSSNWVGSETNDLLVLGGNKRSIIEQFPILKWSHEQFSSYLSQPNTRLMVIGYSFADEHINDIIRKAAAAETLDLFVIDPLGVDVIDKNRNAQIYRPDDLAQVLWPRVIGSSRRSLREIFGYDRAEHDKVMRFFA